MSEQRPLHEGLFNGLNDKPELLGSRCNQCGQHAFPAQSSCRNCTGNDTTVVSLGHEGHLWTWTIQTFMPKDPYLTDETPETFTPYGVGYVELECGLRVESRLRQNTTDSLQIGMPMTLELIPVRKADNGDELLTFQFTAKETL